MFILTVIYISGLKSTFYYTYMPDIVYIYNEGLQINGIIIDFPYPLKRWVIVDYDKVKTTNQIISY